MGCRVVKVLAKNNKISKLYQDLALQYGAEVALDRYLHALSLDSDSFSTLDENGEPTKDELTNKVMYKLPEMETLEVQRNTMEFLSSNVQEALVELTDNSSDFIGGFDVTQFQDPVLFDRVLKRAEEIGRFKLSSSMDLDTAEVLSGAINNMRSYISDPESNVKGKLYYQLMDDGIIIDSANSTSTAVDSEDAQVLSENTNDVNSVDLNNDESVEDLFDKRARIYSLDKLNTSTKSEVNRRHALKYMLKNLKSPRTSNSLGLPARAPFSSTLAQLFSSFENIGRPELSGDIDSDMMITKMRALAKKDGRFKSLVTALEEEFNSPKIFKSYPNVKEAVGAARPLANTIYTVFGKQNYNMLDTVIMEDSGNMKVVLANSRSEGTKVLNDFKAAAATNKTKNGSVIGVIDSINDNLKTAQDRPGGDMLPNDYQLLSIKLAKIGLDVSKSELKKVAQKMLKDKSNFGMANVRSEAGVMRVLSDRVFRNIASGNLEAFSFNKKGAKGELKTLKGFVDAFSSSRADLGNKSFLSSDGKVIHPVNESSEGFAVLNEFSQDFQSSMEKFGEDETEMLLRTHLANVFSSEGENVVQYNYNVNIDERNKRTATKFGDNSYMRSSVESMYRFFNADRDGRTDAGHYLAPSILKGDRGKLGLISVPKVTENQYKSWVQNKLISNALRIQKVEALANQGKISRDSSMYINGTTFTVSNINDIDSAKAAINKIKAPGTTYDEVVSIAKSLQEDTLASLDSYLQEDIDFLVDNGVLYKKGNSYALTVTAKDLATNITENPNAFISSSDLKSWLKSDLVYVRDQFTFIIGDPYLFKRGKNTDNTVDVNARIVDLNKRAGVPYTPGTRGVYSDPFSNVVVLDPRDEAVINSELGSLMGALVEGGKDYGKMDIADGTTFASIRSYTKELVARSEHTPKDLKRLDYELSDAKYDPTYDPDMGEVLITKHLHSENMVHPEWGVPITLMQKDSKVHLTKALVQGSPILSKLKQLLDDPNSGVDEISFNSAVKTELPTVRLQSLLEGGPEVSERVITKDLRRGVVSSPTPDKNSVKSTLGSQVKHLAGAGVNPEAEIYRNGGKETIKMKDLDATFTEIQGSIADSASESISEKYKPGKDLVNKVSGSLVDSGKLSREYIEEASDPSLGDVITGSHPSISRSINSGILSDSRSKGSGFKVSGGDYVQKTSWGLEATKEGDNIRVGSDLKFAEVQTRVDGKTLNKNQLSGLSKSLDEAIQTGDAKSLSNLNSKFKVSKAEIRVTPKYFRKSIEDKILRNSNAKSRIKSTSYKIMGSSSFIRKVALKYDIDASEVTKDHIDSMSTSALLEAKNAYLQNEMWQYTDNNGNLDIRKIKNDDPSLLDVVMYRTPTQGDNSILVGTIKEFLPEGSGPTVEVPGEVVIQAGSDFDIDKLKVMFRDFSMDNRGSLKSIEGSTQNPTNDIIDFMSDVLSNVSSVKKYLSPNSTSVLESLLDKKDVAKTPSLFGSLKQREIDRLAANDGNKIIGRASLAAVAHALARKSKMKTYGDVFFGIDKEGKPIKVTFTDTIHTNTLDGKYRFISKDLEEIQNAALDNANNPILGYFNVNEFTSDAVLGLIASGYGLEHALAVVDNPYVRDLTQKSKEYFRTKPMDQESVDIFLEEVVGIDLRSEKSLGKHETLEGIQSLVLSGDVVNLMKVFSRAMDIGRGFSTYVLQNKFVSDGAPKDVVSLFEMLGEKAGDRTSATYDMMYPKEAPKKKLKSKDDIKNAIVQASSKVDFTKRNIDTKNTYDRKEVKKVSASQKVYGGKTISEKATKTGSLVDKSFRDLVSGRGKTTDSEGYSMTDAAYNQLKNITSVLQENIVGDFITEPENLKLLFEENEGQFVSGEMDMAVVNNGSVKIGDVKVRLSTTNVESGIAVEKRVNNWRDQISIYAKGVENIVPGTVDGGFVLPIVAELDGNTVVSLKLDKEFIGSNTGFISVDIEKQLTINKVKDKVDSNLRRSIQLYKPEKDSDPNRVIINNNSAKGGKSLHRRLEKGNLIDTARTISKATLLGSKNFHEASSTLVSLAGKKKMPFKFKNVIESEFQSFLALNASSYTSLGPTSIEMRNTAEYIDSITIAGSDANVAERVAKLVASRKGIKNKYPILQLVGPVNKEYTVDEGSTKVSRTFLGLPGYTTAAMESFDNDSIRKSWEEMALSGDPEISSLATDMYYYTRVLHGFKGGFNSLNNFVPVSFMRSSLPGTMSEFEFFSKIDEALLSGEDAIYSAGFAKEFAVHAIRSNKDTFINYYHKKGHSKPQGIDSRSYFDLETMTIRIEGDTYSEKGFGIYGQEFSNSRRSLVLGKDAYASGVRYQVDMNNLSEENLLIANSLLGNVSTIGLYENRSEATLGTNPEDRSSSSDLYFDSYKYNSVPLSQAVVEAADNKAVLQIMNSVIYNLVDPKDRGTFLSRTSLDSIFKERKGKIKMNTTSPAESRALLKEEGVSSVLELFNEGKVLDYFNKFNKENIINCKS